MGVKIQCIHTLNLLLLLFLLIFLVCQMFLCFCFSLKTPRQLNGEKKLKVNMIFIFIFDQKII